MSHENWLPTQIVNRADIIHLLQELETHEQNLQEAKIRKTETVPDVSKLLKEVAQFVGVDIVKSEDITKLKDWLKKTKQSAPVVHISFSSNPSGDFLQKITAWFRKEINPLTLLQVGIQPSIAAGCTVRTTSKYFDMSLRSHLQGKNDLLFERVREVKNG